MSVWYNTNEIETLKPSVFYEFRLHVSQVFKSLEKDLRFTYDDQLAKFKIDTNETKFSEIEIIDKLGSFGKFIVSKN